MKTLYAGPWAGEFGWELCSWNPLVRKKAEEYERVIVEGPPTSRFLYEFAHEYIDNPIIPNSSDGYKGKLEKTACIPRGCDVFSPNWLKQGRLDMRSFASPFIPNPNKTWRCLATEPAFVADVLCSFRTEKKYRKRTFSDKEYPFEMCAELVQLLLKRGLTVACIGGHDNHYISNTTDLRGKTLEIQCAAISAARVVIGPSSGPMHLASLCKVPHVVWYNRKDTSSSQARYGDHWNPFGTPYTYMQQALPTPEQIISAVEPYART